MAEKRRKATERAKSGTPRQRAGRKPAPPVDGERGLSLLPSAPLEVPGSGLDSERPSDNGLRPYLATNHFNFIAALGSGVFKPREGYRKYYTDLLELTPGGLPVVFNLVRPNIVEYVTREKFSLPVAIELDEKYLPLQSLSDKSGGAIVVPGALPLEAARRAVFRSEADLKEALARHYDGVNYDRVAMVVDPSVFSSDETGDELPFIQAEKARATGMPEGLFRRADRCAGAISLAATLLPKISSDPRDVALLFHAKLPGHQESGAILTQGWDVGTPTVRGADDALFYAAFEALCATDRLESWDPIRVLKAIVDRFSEASLDVTSEVLDVLRTVWKILRLESPYQTFSNVAGADAANSVLWVLAQPDPEAFIAAGWNISIRSSAATSLDTVGRAQRL